MDNKKRFISNFLKILIIIFVLTALIWVIIKYIDMMNYEKRLDEMRVELTPLPSVNTPALSQDPSPETTAADGDVHNDGAEGSDAVLGQPAADGDSAYDSRELVDNPYADSFKGNGDMAGWLLIPDTMIDYPVMWTPEDEQKYLYLDYDGKYSNNGSLILDTDSCLDPITTNLIIHGHNMRSGAMFGNLTAYEKKTYCDEHKDIYLYTEECERHYEVIAVFRSQVYKKTDEVFKFYKFFQADTEEEFDDFYQNIKSLSLYDTGVSAEFGDCFITLSTCAYHAPQGRFVVVAKETECGDYYKPIE